jgi:hypothetical protein
MTPEQIEAIDWAAALAIDDQQAWLDARAWADYGNDWPEAAGLKALSFRHLAEVLRNLGKHETADHAVNLAKQFEDVRWRP